MPDCHREQGQEIDILCNECGAMICTASPHNLKSTLNEILETVASPVSARRGEEEANVVW